MTLYKFSFESFSIVSSYIAQFRNLSETDPTGNLISRDHIRVYVVPRSYFVRLSQDRCSDADGVPSGSAATVLSLVPWSCNFPFLSPGVSQFSKELWSLLVMTTSEKIRSGAGGRLAGSVSRARNSSSRGCEFEPPTPLGVEIKKHGKKPPRSGCAWSAHCY